MDLFAKCNRFTRAREYAKLGLYPYFRVIEESQGTEVVIEGKRMLMIGSNNYLGLTHHPYVLEKARRALKDFGSGCTGSRFLNGTLSLHVELEEKLARFFDREAALTFSTGFQTNLGVIAALTNKHDVIFCDRENHASIIDGTRLSFADVRKFKHSDMEDLERLLSLSREDDVGRLIILDGVFSMMGDIAPLEEVARLAQEYDARILVDEAHAVGVLGSHGRGATEHCGVEKEVDLVLGTFSKSLASIGGFVAGPEDVIHYIKHFSRPLIFSASIPPASVATVIAALEVLEAEPERRKTLWENTERVRQGLTSMGFDLGTSQTPIIPVIIGDQELTFRFWRMLTEEGIFANPVTSPAVPPGMDLIRTSYMATHTPAQIDRVLETFEKVGRRLRLVA